MTGDPVIFLCKVKNSGNTFFGGEKFDVGTVCGTYDFLFTLQGKEDFRGNV